MTLWLNQANEYGSLLHTVIRVALLKHHVPLKNQSENELL